MTNKDKIISAVTNASNHNSKLEENILGMDGMSSVEVRHLLNNLVDEKTRYLDIGTWKGSVVMSALYKNNPEFYITIDDASHHGNQADIFLSKFREIFKKEPNYLTKDSFSINPAEHGIENINLYFYDGGHEYEQHYNAVPYFYSYLADEFILIVDDYKDVEKIQHATQKSIKDMNLKIDYEAILPPEEGWWHGIYIAACRK